MHALLLRIPRRSILIELPRAQILVQDVEIGITLKDCGVDRRQHDSWGSRECLAWLLWLFGGFAGVHVYDVSRAS